VTVAADRKTVAEVHVPGAVTTVDVATAHILGASDRLRRGIVVYRRFSAGWRRAERRW